MENLHTANPQMCVRSGVAREKQNWRMSLVWWENTLRMTVFHLCWAELTTSNLNRKVQWDSSHLRSHAKTINAGAKTLLQALQNYFCDKCFIKGVPSPIKDTSLSCETVHEPHDLKMTFITVIVCYFYKSSHVKSQYWETKTHLITAIQIPLTSHCVSAEWWSLGNKSFPLSKQQALHRLTTFAETYY